MLKQAMIDQALSSIDVGFRKLIPTDEVSKDRYKTTEALIIGNIQSCHFVNEFLSLNGPIDVTG